MGLAGSHNSSAGIWNGSGRNAQRMPSVLSAPHSSVWWLNWFVRHSITSLPSAVVIAAEL